MVSSWGSTGEAIVSIGGASTGRDVRYTARLASSQSSSLMSVRAVKTSHSGVPVVPVELALRLFSSTSTVKRGGPTFSCSACPSRLRENPAVPLPPRCPWPSSPLWVSLVRPTPTQRARQTPIRTGCSSRRPSCSSCPATVAARRRCRPAAPRCAASSPRSRSAATESRRAGSAVSSGVRTPARRARHPRTHLDILISHPPPLLPVALSARAPVPRFPELAHFLAQTAHFLVPVAQAVGHRELLVLRGCLCAIQRRELCTHSVQLRVEVRNKRRR